MQVTDFLSMVLRPAEAAFAGVCQAPETPEATVMMLAIAGQESSWSNRVQLPNGQARGFWQCEERGAVFSVLVNAWAGPKLKAWCVQRAIVPGLSVLFEAIAWHDPLAFAIARLQLELDPKPLPAIGDIEDAWQTYLRVWRPGKPSRERWNLVYPAAAGAVPSDAADAA